MQSFSFSSHNSAVQVPLACGKPSEAKVQGSHLVTLSSSRASESFMGSSTFRQQMEEGRMEKAGTCFLTISAGRAHTTFTPNLWTGTGRVAPPQCRRPWKMASWPGRCIPVTWLGHESLVGSCLPLPEGRPEDGIAICLRLCSSCFLPLECPASTWDKSACLFRDSSTCMAHGPL